MRRGEFVPVTAVGALALWVAVQAHRMHVPLHRSAGTAASGMSAAPAPSAGASIDETGPVPAGAERLLGADREGEGDASSNATPELTRRGPPTPAPVRDLAEIHRRLLDNQAGTYIGEILTERDSTIVRWPDRTSHPLRVWVQSGDRIAGWDPAYVNQVRNAFTTWESVGIPVLYTFVLDSSDADVRVTWIDHFTDPISGRTLWGRDASSWIVAANITIALHHHQGQALDATGVRAIALHEVGHLLGLDHCADTTNIMAAHVHVRDLSAADRATIRLIYALPPGSVR